MVHFYFSFVDFQVDFEELTDKLKRLEVDCQQAMENLRKIIKHENFSTQNLRRNVTNLLIDCAERICVLKTIHKRVISRWVVV